MEPKKNQSKLPFLALLGSCLLLASVAFAQNFTFSGNFDINLDNLSDAVNSLTLTVANMVGGIASVSGFIGKAFGFILVIGVILGLLIMFNPFDWLNRTGFGRMLGHYTGRR